MNAPDYCTRHPQRNITSVCPPLNLTAPFFKGGKFGQYSAVVIHRGSSEVSFPWRWDDVNSVGLLPATLDIVLPIGVETEVTEGAEILCMLCEQVNNSVHFIRRHHECDSNKPALVLTLLGHTEKTKMAKDPTCVKILCTICDYDFKPFEASDLCSDKETLRECIKYVEANNGEPVVIPEGLLGVSEIISNEFSLIIETFDLYMNDMHNVVQIGKGVSSDDAFADASAENISSPSTVSNYEIKPWGQTSNIPTANNRTLSPTSPNFAVESPEEYRRQAAGFCSPDDCSTAGSPNSAKTAPDEVIRSATFSYMISENTLGRQMALEQPNDARACSSTIPAVAKKSRRYRHNPYALYTANFGYSASNNNTLMTPAPTECSPLVRSVGSALPVTPYSRTVPRHVDVFTDTARQYESMERNAMIALYSPTMDRDSEVQSSALSATPIHRGCATRSFLSSPVSPKTPVQELGGHAGSYLHSIRASMMQNAPQYQKILSRSVAICGIYRNCTSKELIDIASGDQPLKLSLRNYKLHMSHRHQYNNSLAWRHNDHIIFSNPTFPRNNPVLSPFVSSSSTDSVVEQRPFHKRRTVVGLSIRNPVYVIEFARKAEADCFFEQLKVCRNDLASMQASIAWFPDVSVPNVIIYSRCFIIPDALREQNETYTYPEEYEMLTQRGFSGADLGILVDDHGIPLQCATKGHSPQYRSKSCATPSAVKPAHIHSEGDTVPARVHERALSIPFQGRPNSPAFSNDVKRKLFNPSAELANECNYIDVFFAQWASKEVSTLMQPSAAMVCIIESMRPFLCLYGNTYSSDSQLAALQRAIALLNGDEYAQCTESLMENKLPSILDLYKVAVVHGAASRLKKAFSVQLELVKANKEHLSDESTYNQLREIIAQVLFILFHISPVIYLCALNKKDSKTSLPPLSFIQYALKLCVSFIKKTLISTVAAVFDSDHFHQCVTGEGRNITVFIVNLLLNLALWMEAAQLLIICRLLIDNDTKVENTDKSKKKREMMTLSAFRFGMLVRELYKCALAAATSGGEQDCISYLESLAESVSDDSAGLKPTQISIAMFSESKNPLNSLLYCPVSFIKGRLMMRKLFPK